MEKRIDLDRARTRLQGLKTDPKRLQELAEQIERNRQRLEDIRSRAHADLKTQYTAM